MTEPKNKTLNDALAEQLEQLLNEHRQMRSRSRHDDLSDLSDLELLRLTSRVRAALERIGGRSSPYVRQHEEIQQSRLYPSPGPRLVASVGVMQGLLDDLKAGHLRTLSELLHAEVFADLLEMAEHLLSQGYKDAAAVVTGATLESQLKRLAESAQIDLLTEGDPPRPKKADRLNAELAAAEIYSKLDQKNVTAWLDLRNKAAHGEYSTYSEQQVQLLLASVRDFITRHPS